MVYINSETTVDYSLHYTDVSSYVFSECL